MARRRPPAVAQQAVTDEALARMYRERVAARGAGRRPYQLAVVWGAGTLEPLTPIIGEHLVAAGWERQRVDALLNNAVTTDSPEAAYSAARDSVWSPDLSEAEFPDLRDAPPGSLAAYEYTRAGLLHLRSMLRDP